MTELLTIEQYKEQRLAEGEPVTMIAWCRRCQVPVAELNTMWIRDKRGLRLRETLTSYNRQVEDHHKNTGHDDFAHAYYDKLGVEIRELKE